MVPSCRRPRPGGWSSLALVLLQLAVLLRAYRYPEGRSCLLLRLSNGAGARPPPLMRRARRPLSPPLFPLGPSSGSWPAADRARAMRAAESSEAERQTGSADGSREGTVRTCRVCHQTFISELNHDRACRYHPGDWLGAENSKFVGTRSGGPNTGLSLFYDCCGADRYDAPGCAFTRHKTYDEDE